ncbi:hypothetical protein Emed_007266 [Eimeria media]
MAQRNSSQAPAASTFRPGLSTMEFQGSSPPATTARREQTQAGGAELGAANPRPAYYNLDAQAVLFTPTRHPGPSIRLEPFDGTKFRMWIRVADAYYEALNLNDEDRIKNVQFHLTGDALDYWLMLNEDAPENRPSNWEEFKAVMSRRFDTSDAYTALHALSKLKYEGDFNRYVSEFGKLIARSKRLPAELKRQTKSGEEVTTDSQSVTDSIKGMETAVFPPNLASTGRQTLQARAVALASPSSRMGIDNGNAPIPRWEIGENRQIATGVAEGGIGQFYVHYPRLRTT